MSYQLSIPVKRIRLKLLKTNSLTDSPEYLEVEWILNTSKIAEKYFEALKIAEAKDYFYRNDRFYNFPNDPVTKRQIVNKLNENIQLINSYYPALIDFVISYEMSQDEMNRLHVYFEKYRGPLLNPSRYYSEGPIFIKEAFDNLNLLIHRYEDMGFSNREKKLTPKTYVTFGLNEDIKRYPLEEDDFYNFTFKLDFGSWVINYCEVGKPLHDIWRDQDEHIGKDVTLPLRYYSADGLIIFGDEVDDIEDKNQLKRFYEWWDFNKKQLDQIGFKKFDPKNALGNLPVAKLDFNQPVLKGLSKLEIVNLISNYQKLHKIKVLEHPQ